MSYFGPVAIKEGAAGLGQYDGMLAAYRDGVVGGHGGDPMPGPLAAFRDGSLGQIEGQLHAYADGVLGGRPGATGDGALLAYRDGSLGRYRRRGGLRGLGEYFLSGLGATATLDLADPGVLTELKMAVALTAPALTMTPEGQQIYSPAWYESGIWDDAAAAAWFQAAQAIATAKGVGPESLTVMTPRMFPNGAGIAALVESFSTSPSYGESYVATTFPRLSAGAGAVVSPPYFSLEEKVTGESAPAAPFQMSRMAMYGLGAAVIAGVVLVVQKKRKK